MEDVYETRWQLFQDRAAGAVALADLNRAIEDAVTFLAQVEETLTDEHQTAREVLAHFVFWHREYVWIIRALAADRQPRLRDGKFSELNVQATREFTSESMPALASRLVSLQKQLDRALRALPDWRANFPIKAGGKRTSIAARVPQITAHIRNHVARLRRAAKRKARRVSAK